MESWFGSRLKGQLVFLEVTFKFKVMCVKCQCFVFSEWRTDFAVEHSGEHSPHPGCDKYNNQQMAVRSV